MNSRGLNGFRALTVVILWVILWSGVTAFESAQAAQPSAGPLVGDPPAAPAQEVHYAEPDALEPETTTHYRLGIITAITVPQPLSVGLTAIPSYDPNLAFFVEGGYFQYAFGSGRKLKDWTTMVGVKYRPFSNWFFMGLEFGYRHIGFNADISSFKMDGEALADSAVLRSNAIFFGVIFGGEWKLSPNVGIGFDLGLQMAPISWGDVTIIPVANSADETDLSVDNDSFKRVTAIPIPQIALIRFIWYI